MKTTKIISIAILATCLASCGGKTGSGDSAADSTEVAATDANAEITSVEQIVSVEQVTNQIKAAIESGEQQKAESIVAVLQQKLNELKTAGDEASLTQLKEYAVALETLCKENAEKIKSMGTLGTVITTAVSETGVEDVVSALQNLGISTAAAGDAAAAAAQSQADAAAAAVQSQADAAVNEAKSKANDAVNKAVSDAQNKANDAVNKAQSKANDAINDAAKKALGM